MFPNDVSSGHIVGGRCLIWHHVGAGSRQGRDIHVVDLGGEEVDPHGEEDQDQEILRTQVSTGLVALHSFPPPITHLSISTKGKEAYLALNKPLYAYFALLSIVL